jgi:hypothetical protein
MTKSGREMISQREQEEARSGITSVLSTCNTSLSRLFNSPKPPSRLILSLSIKLSELATRCCPPSRLPPPNPDDDRLPNAEGGTSGFPVAAKKSALDGRRSEESERKEGVMPDLGGATAGLGELKDDRRGASMP